MINSARNYFKTNTVSSKYFQTGFTLIELLIVMAIIGVLASVIILFPIGSSKRARDARRESDLKQYQSSLEVYASRNVSGLYPSRTDVAGVPASTTLCSDLGLTNCSADPYYSQNNTYIYNYQSNGTTGTVTATQYILWGKMEAVTNYFVVCSNGKTGTVAQAGWVNPTNGSCPL